MNKTNHDRIWELAAAKLHDEASESELNELAEKGLQKDNETIIQETTHLHYRIKETSPLQKSSLVSSWNKIAGYIRSKKTRLYLNVAKYAAVLLLAFAAGTLINFNWKPFPENDPVYTEIVAPPGQMTEMTLYDGTKVWLNSGTVLRYAGDFGNQSRTVEMEGEAFFKVNPSEIPFKIRFKNHEVKVLGTSFAAVAYPDEAFSQVTLVEGSVQINDFMGREIKQLESNQQIHIPDNPKEKITTREVSTLFYESWINGQIKFEEERLADVARRLERWYNVDIRFTDKEASNLRFTGTVLKTKPIDQSMMAISLLLPIQVKHESNLDKKDVIIISKN